MKRIQVALDRKLLQATDRAARRNCQSRSALVRDAIQEHLRRLEVRALENRDRTGYTKKPADVGYSLAWEAKASWPPE